MLVLELDKEAWYTDCDVIEGCKQAIPFDRWPPNREQSISTSKESKGSKSRGGESV